MLSYQHSYHAGNFTDLMKHIVLVRLLTYLSIKETPYFYLDTHTGRGLYDLQSQDALKNCEFKSGIEMLWTFNEPMPELVQQYLNIVREYNPDQNLHFYPGSLAIALKLQRAQDRAYATELHPGEYEQLLQMNTQNKRVFIEKTDGLKKMLALLPPYEKRAVIFIDPAFELQNDYRTIPESISQAYKKFPRGIFCLWYPVVDNGHHEKLCCALDKICKNAIQLEFEIDPSLTGRMNRCGLWIANPPFTLKDEIQQTFSFLTDKVYLGRSSFAVI